MRVLIIFPVAACCQAAHTILFGRDSLLLRAVKLPIESCSVMISCCPMLSSSCSHTGGEQFLPLMLTRSGSVLTIADTTFNGDITDVSSAYPL